MALAPLTYSGGAPSLQYNVCPHCPAPNSANICHCALLFFFFFLQFSKQYCISHISNIFQPTLLHILFIDPITKVGLEIHGKMEGVQYSTMCLLIRHTTIFGLKKMKIKKKILFTAEDPKLGSWIIREMKINYCTYCTVTCVGASTFPQIRGLGLVHWIVSTNQVTSCHNKLQLHNGPSNYSPTSA